jgi:ubiquinone/menaquinone biosynthesis C-methylase UbiE
MNERDGWASSKAAQRHIHVQSDMVPGRSEVLPLIASLAAACSSPRPSFLDLGCGHGDVTAELLTATPGASVTMVDFSDEMLRRARERFLNDDRVSILKHDLNRGLPGALAESRFDAAVSCFAFHHIELENRVMLYGQIRGVLRPDGLFINGDRFRGESPAIGAWEFDNWVGWMTARAKERFGITKTSAEIRRRQLEMDEELGDKPGSIWAMRDDLKQAGFAHIDCLYKNQITAVIVALNQLP